jgi:6-phosphogluconolactonase
MGFPARVKRLLRVFLPALLNAGLYLCAMSAHAGSSNSLMRVYIGTYTGAKSKGIYVSDFDPETGKLGAPELAARTGSPSFLALHPNHCFLYVVDENGNVGGKMSGAVRAFRIDPATGGLTLLNDQPSGGGGPCHLSVNHSGQCLLVANYGSGSVAALPIGADGTLGAPATKIQHVGSSINHGRQAGPHAHFIAADPDDRFALACDLGLDKILVYRLDAAKGLLVANDPPAGRVTPGLGPRHLVFHPNGRFAYVISEMGSTITAFTYDAKRGQMEEIQTLSTLPADFSGKSGGAEIQIHPSGKFLYGSNRGHDSVALFAVDSETGRLRFVECQSTQGRTPRHFEIDPSGKWLLAENQDSDSVVVFQLDQATGKLNPTGQTVSVGAPACALFWSAK